MNKHIKSLYPWARNYDKGGPKRDKFYNTQLTPEQEQQYQKWVQTLPINLRSDYDYDLRGAWLNGDLPDQNYHMPDTWKKPWHPTFSNESIYSTPGAEGGRWDGEEFHPSRLNRTLQSFKFGEWGGSTFAKGGPKKTYTAEQLAAMVNAQRNAELAGFNPMSSAYNGPAITPASTTAKAVPYTQTPAGVKTQQIIQTTQKSTQTTPVNVPEIKTAQSPQMYQSYYTNPLQYGWNNEAANLGYALGAGHPMTLNEMNNWTLNTMNLAGMMAAPTLLGALESGYYFKTKRPVEGALTALLTPVKPTINTIKNIRTNLAFNRSELPQQIIDDVKNAVNNDAQRWVLRASQNDELIPSVEYVNKIQPKVEYKTGFKNWFKYSDTPIRDLFGTGAFNQNGSTIVMNPLASIVHPQAYRGLVAHEARHNFKYPFMPEVSIPTETYYGPNPNFELYGLIDAFEKPALKGKWRGNPEELLAEMANWKYQRGVLDIPYYQLDKQLQEKFIKDASSQFGFNELRTSMILDGLSKYGYFDAGGPIHIKPKNRGKFTAAANRAGKSVQEYASQILANKDSYSAKMIKRANFAKNAKKFHH